MVLVFWLGAALFALAIFTLVKPQPKIRLGSTRNSLIVGGLGVVLLLFGASGSPPSSASPDGGPSGATGTATAQRAIPSIKDASSSIKEADGNEVNLNVLVFIEPTWNSVSHIDQVALVTRYIGEAVQEGKAREDEARPEWLQMRVHIAGTDRLGNDSEIDAFNLRFPMADIRAARFSNLGLDRIMALADTVQINHREGAAIWAAWCSKPENLDDALAQCRQALEEG